MKNADIAIIGGGVVGCSIAWELSKYKIKTIVLEMGSDVASETSKANSGVIHSGINSATGSLKAKFCVQGNKMIESLSKEIGFSLKWIGKYVIAKNDYEIKELDRLKEVGEKNGVENLRLVDKKTIKKSEPNVPCEKALWVPTAGILLPYEFTISLAQNAAINKVDFYLETKVKAIEKEKDGYLIKTNNGDFNSKIVINSSGLNCRNICSMIEEPDFNVYPCRGEYLVLDKTYGNLVNSMIYPIPPKEKGVLGVHITPTIEGNILLGPSAEFIKDGFDKRTTKKTMNDLIKDAQDIVPKIPNNSVINAYSGIRCKLASKKEGGWADYKIYESKNNPGIVNLLGIESPGLTAAPAIANHVRDIISNSFDLEKKSKIIKKNYFTKHFSEMNAKEQNSLVKKDSRWGRIICRCEKVTEAEIIKALSNPLGAKTLSSVKYRTRAGMGRCQGGFCKQHIVRIMQDEFNMKLDDIKLKSPKSKMFFNKSRGVNDD